MLTAFLTTLEQMLRIVLFLAIGFGMNKLHILPKGASSGISKLATTLFLPAMLLHSNMTEFNLADVATYGQIVMLGVVLWTVVTIPCIWIANRLSGGDYNERGVYLYGLSFPNSGAIGRPLALAIAGTVGLFQYNLFLLMYVIMTYAWGVGLFLNGESKHPIKRFFVGLINPVFLSMLAGLILGALGSRNWMPPVITQVVGDLGDCFVPVSLLMAGYAVADYPFGEVLKRPKSYIFTALRLLIIPLGVMFALRFAGVSKELTTLVLFALSSPSGMNVVVFPAAYGRDCKTGASIVLMSCLGAIITMPLLYALLQVIYS